MGLQISSSWTSPQSATSMGLAITQPIGWMTYFLKTKMNIKQIQYAQLRYFNTGRRATVKWQREICHAFNQFINKWFL